MPQSQTPRILACLRAVQAFIHKRDRGTGTMVEQLVRHGTCRQGRHLSGAQAYRRGDGRVLAQRVAAWLRCATRRIRISRRTGSNSASTHDR